MRRWVLIILLLVYPFQVALAMADQCCVTTPNGVTHHAAEGGTGTTLEPAFLADDGDSPLSDPHCPSCMLGHILYLPSHDAATPGQRHEPAAIAAILPFVSSPPASRPERPKWLLRAWRAA